MEDVLTWTTRLQKNLADIEQDFDLFAACHNGDPSAYDARDRLDEDCEPIDAIRIQVTKALGLVLQELVRQPAFQAAQGHGLGPLRMLAVELLNLDRGNRSALFETRKVSREAPHDEAERKAGAVAIVELFEATGLENAPARREAAKVLSDAGVRGRKGGAFSAQTLHDWQIEVRATDAEPRIKGLLDSYRTIISGYAQQPTKQQAKLLGAVIASSKAFSLKI